MKTVGEFYDLIMLRFICKFGNNLSMIKVNPAKDPPDPEDFEENETLTAEEAATKRENFKIIRKVRIFSYSTRNILLTTYIEIIPVVP